MKKLLTVFLVTATSFSAHCEVAPPARLKTGEIQSIDESQVKIRDDQGKVLLLPLLTNIPIYVGQAVGRGELKLGDIVAAPVNILRYRGVAGYSAYWFLIAERSSSFVNQLNTLKQFIPLDTRTSDSDVAHSIVGGRFRSLTSGAVMDIAQSRGQISIKLGPEAAGYLLHPVGRSALRVGSRASFVVAEGRVLSALVFEGEAATRP